MATTKVSGKEERREDVELGGLGQMDKNLSLFLFFFVLEYIFSSRCLFFLPVLWFAIGFVCTNV